MITVSPLDRVCTLVTSSVAFFDVVTLGISRHLSADEQSTLRSLCGDLHYRQALCADGMLVWCIVDGEIIRVQVALTLRQPSEDAIRFIEQLCLETGMEALVWKVEAALDWSTRTNTDAIELHSLVEPLLLRTGKGSAVQVKRWENAEGRTTAIGSRGRGYQLIIYSGRLSKTTGRPCLHIEWRAVGRRSTEAFGFTTVFDLRRFFHGAFWRKRLPLSVLDHEALGKRLAGRHGNAKAERTRSGNLIFNKDLARARRFIRDGAQQIGVAVERLTLTETLGLLRQAGIETRRLMRRLHVPGELLPFGQGLKRAPSLRNPKKRR